MISRLSHVRVRVTLVAVVVALIGAVIGSVLFVRGLRASLEQALLDSAQQQAATLVAQLKAGDSAQDEVVSGKRDVIVQVLDAHGKVVASDHPRVTEPIRTVPGLDTGAHIQGFDDTFSVRALRAADGGLVVVGRSEEQVARATDTAVDLLAWSVPIGVLLLGALVWLALGRALRPVEVMRREAAAITSEHLHRRLAVPPGDDEIPRLATTLNQMLDRIDAAQQQQRQFVSDASHELRSPLAVLRQMAEVALRYPDSTTVTKLAGDLRDEEAHMEGVVKALLTLARLDDAESARDQVVDLDDAVLGEVDRLRAKGARVIFDRSGVSAGQAYGDPVLFAQVVSNLLSNAARHATSKVAISLVERGGRVVLTVGDDGPGIAPTDRDRIFDRFTRLDEARARDAGGVGLGLAIVAKVVELSHGTIEVGESPLGGASFSVSLPAATTAER